jgi:hypothetical protein
MKLVQAINHKSDFVDAWIAKANLFGQGGLGTGSGIDGFDSRSQGLAVFPIGIVQTVANQVHDKKLPCL